MDLTWPFPKLNPVVAATDAKTVTLKWTPAPACGYRFSVDGRVVSHTWNENQATVKFGIVPGGPHAYEVEPIWIGPGEKILF